MSAHPHRHPAGSGAHSRRDGSLAVHGAQQSVLERELNAPLANLPVVIFQYAMSPYDEWHALAWAGAFVLTAFVLILNLLVRFSPGKADIDERRGNDASDHDRRASRQTSTAS